MSDRTEILNAATRKPAFGSPCNGCGLCCLVEPCPLAMDFIPDAQSGRCSALEHDGDRFWCGLLRQPHKYIEGLQNKPWADGAIQEIILSSGAFNTGCDSDDIDINDIP